MKLSVIIPCKNEVGTLEHLLDSLTLQSHPADEVIVVDSHSTDATASVAKSYEDRLPIKVVTAQKKGLAHARNEGAQQASHELLMFIDADVQLPKNCLAKLHQAVTKRHLQVGGFAQHMATSSAGLKFGSYFMNGYVRVMSCTPWPIFFSCFFITKEFHQKLNGFDSEVWIMEDYDYAYRARKAGAKFGLVRGTHFVASSRRFEQKDTHAVLKAAYAEIYRYTHGMRITKPLFTYEMGGEEKTKKS